MMTDTAKPDADARTATRRMPLAWVLVLSLAAGFRFWGLGSKALWLDEVMSLRLATQPTLASMLREAASYDNHPPFYALLHFLWLRPVEMRWGPDRVQWGNNPGLRLDGYARVPSVLFGLGTVALTLLVARQLFNQRLALLAGALAAISAFQVYFSQEARPYALVTLLALGLTCVFLRMLATPEHVPARLWCAYALLGILLLYTFVLGLLAIITHALIFAAAGRLSRRNIIGGCLASVGMALAFLPWLPNLATAWRLDARLPAVPFNARVSGLVAAFGQWLAGPLDFEPFLLGVSALGLLTVAFILCRRTTQRAAILGAHILLPACLYLIVSFGAAWHFQPKHLIFVAPFSLMLVAGAVGNARWRGLAVGLVLAVALANLGELAVYYDTTYEKERWREVATYLESREEVGDIILTDPAYVVTPLNYHYRGRMTAWGISADDPRRAVRRIEDISRVAGVRRAFFVACSSRVARPRVLTENYFGPAWQPISLRVFDGALGTITVTTFVLRPEDQNLTLP